RGAVRRKDRLPRPVAHGGHAREGGGRGGRVEGEAEELAGQLAGRGELWGVRPYGGLDESLGRARQRRQVDGPRLQVDGGDLVVREAGGVGVAAVRAHGERVRARDEDVDLLREGHGVGVDEGERGGRACGGHGAAGQEQALRRV